MNPPSIPYTSTTPTNPSSSQSPKIETSNFGSSVGRGRPRGAMTGTGAKRGRKPRGGSTLGNASPRMSPQESLGSTSPVFSSPQFPHVHWAMPTSTTQTSTSSPTSASGSGIEAQTQGNAIASSSTSNPYTAALLRQSQSQTSQSQQPQASQSSQIPATTYSALSNPSVPLGINFTMPSGSTVPTLDTTGLLRLSGTNPPVLPLGSSVLTRPLGVDDDGDGEDEVLPAMADDDYSAQLSWQSQSKDNLKVLMDNFNPSQYDRFEAYRRHALPKQAVRKVIQQTVGQQVSQPVAQIVAGFAKVFVGEIVEKARTVQLRRGETGPLSPDHLREAYRIYQEETGRVGAARPLKSKRLFVR